MGVYKELSLYIVSEKEMKKEIEKGFSHPYKYKIHDGFYNHAAFRTKRGLLTFLNKAGLKVNFKKRIGWNRRFFNIEGSYSTVMVKERPQNLKQVAWLINGSVNRAYKEVKGNHTNIYVMSNYPEKFTFKWGTPNGTKYLNRFFNR